MSILFENQQFTAVPFITSIRW